MIILKKKMQENLAKPIYFAKEEILSFLQLEIVMRCYGFLKLHTAVHTRITQSSFSAIGRFYLK